MSLTVGSLFAGIGGFDLGLERAGFSVRWQCECDPFCLAVLAQHWPDVRRFTDIRRLGIDEQPEPVDVLCGGFPCQDISVAGRGVGIDGARSGLWSEFDRLIRQLRPRYVVVENVSALLTRGMGRVLGDLAAGGYDAEWDCLPASAFGAPHQRDRVWLVAHTASGRGERRRPGFEEAESGRAQRLSARSGKDISYAECDDLRHESESEQWLGCATEFGDNGASRAMAARVDHDRHTAGNVESSHSRQPSTRAAMAHTESYGWGSRRSECARFFGSPSIERGSWWKSEPDVGRVAHGVPARVDRLRGLGNAIVPQIAEWLGRQILTAEAMRSAC